jgi:hypothetical protein
VSEYRRAPDEEDEGPSSFVVVHRPTDPIEGEILTQVLRDEGIESRLIGTREGNLIGVPQFVLPLRIEVAASQEMAAEAVIRAYGEREVIEGESESDSDDEQQEKDEEQEEDEDERPDRRSPVLAAGCVMLVFGGSHLYARRPWTSAVIGVTVLSGLLMARRGVWPDRELGSVVVMALLVLDLVFGVRATKAYNRGERPSVGWQLGDGVFLSLLATAVAAALAMRSAIYG